MVESVNHFDSIIIGGGNVGAAAAVSLAQQSYQVAIIDKQPATAIASTDALTARVTALNLASIDFLEQCGVWSQVLAIRATPYVSMHVWEQGGAAEISFQAKETSHNKLGVIVETAVLQTALNQSIQTHDSITHYPNSVLQQCSSVGEDMMLVECEDGTRLTAPLVLGADGQQSQLRTCMQIEFSQKDYHQRGVVAIIESEYVHQDTAWQCFTHQGPLALLPISEQHCSIVWSVPEMRCKELMDMPIADFNQQLTAAFEHKLGRLTVTSERLSFPLQGAQSARYIDHRMALLGDAAHVVHPLAGLGLNLGLADVRCLTDLIAQSDRPLGSARVLRQYELARKSDNAIIQKALEGIDQLFRSDQQLLRSARSMGVNFTNKTAALKMFFMQKALGVAV